MGDNNFLIDDLSDEDSDLLFSVGSERIHCPPRKRSRITGPRAISATSTSNDQRPSIDVLPNKCLVKILKRLPGGPERSASACVSRRWLAVLSSIRQRNRSDAADVINNELTTTSEDENPKVEYDGYLKRILTLNTATDTRLAAIAVSSSSDGGLRKLWIVGSNPLRVVSDIGLRSIARGCPFLRDLSLWHLRNVRSKGLVYIARECRGLKKLDLFDCPKISDKGLTAIAERSRKLTELTINDCPNIGDNSLQAIAMNLPELRALSITDCPLVGDKGVASLLSSASTALETVKLEGLNITDYSVWSIGQYGKGITSLVLSGLRRVSQMGFWMMSRGKGLKMLTSLSVMSCKGVTDMSLTALGQGYPNLNHVTVRNCPLVSDNGLVGFSEAASSLESLHVEECDGINLMEILAALSRSNPQISSVLFTECARIDDPYIEFSDLMPCASLRSLSIQSCSGFGNSNLATIGKLFPNLQRLDLSGFSDLTDDDLLPLLECFGSGLTEVNLSDCSNLTDRAVLALSSLHGGSLDTLNLDGCLNITDEGLDALANHCPLLKDLDVSRCSITDYGVAALTQGVLSNLKALSLHRCSMITNASIPYLAQLRKNMVAMNLEHCYSLSRSTIELFTASFMEA